jgi:hypothetical protein
VALETVAADVKHPCEYRDYGCKKIYGLDFIGEHEEKCRYKIQSCPVKKLNFGTCNWTGISSSVKSHLMEAHKDCLDKNSSMLGFNNRYFHISGVTPATKQCKLLCASNVIFYSCSEIKNGIFYSALLYIGPAADAAKYKYKLEFSDKERPECLAVTLLARSLDEDLNEVHDSGKCVKLYPEQYNCFANDRNELAFSIEICSV